MKNKVVPLRIPENLDVLASLSAQDQHTDKAATLRQWIHRGAELYVLGLVAEGRLSAGRAAELLGRSVHDIYRLAETNGVELGASDEQRRRSRSLADELADGQRSG